MPMNPTIVQSNSGRYMQNAIGGLADAIRGNKQNQIAEESQAQQAAQAMDAMLRHFKANRAQYEAVKAKVNPAVAKFMVPADYSQSDTEAATASLDKTTRDRYANPENITPATSEAALFQNATGAAIPSQVTKANQLRNAIAPPAGYTPTTEEVQSAKVEGGLAESANNASNRGETERHNKVGEGFEGQRTGAYVGHQGAAAGAANALTENRVQERDPNSGIIASKKAVRAVKPGGQSPQAALESDPQFKEYQKQLAGLSKQEQAIIQKFNAATDEKKKEAFRSELMTVRAQIKDWMGRRAKYVASRGASVGAPAAPKSKHFQVDLSSGNVVPISAPPTDGADNEPDDDQDE